MFNQEDTLKFYKKDEFDKIPKNKLMELIHNVSNNEQPLLDSWEEHFQSVNVPYAIVKVKSTDGKTTTKSLWKEKLSDD